MDFGGGSPSPPPIENVEPVNPVEVTPEELSRQASAVRKRRRGVKDLIIDPATNTGADPNAVNTGTGY